MHCPSPQEIHLKWDFPLNISQWLLLSYPWLKIVLFPIVVWILLSPLKLKCYRSLNTVVEAQTVLLTNLMSACLFVAGILCNIDYTLLGINLIWKDAFINTRCIYLPANLLKTIFKQKIDPFSSCKTWFITELLFFF